MKYDDGIPEISFNQWKDKEKMRLLEIRTNLRKAKKCGANSDYKYVAKYIFTRESGLYTVRVIAGSCKGSNAIVSVSTLDKKVAYWLMRYLLHVKNITNCKYNTKTIQARAYKLLDRKKLK